MVDRPSGDTPIQPLGSPAWGRFLFRAMSQQHPAIFGDGWGGTTVASILSALSWIAGGSSPLAVISTLVAIAVGASKLYTDHTKRKAWADFKAREVVATHPMRRKTDRPAMDTQPGRM